MYKYIMLYLVKIKAFEKSQNTKQLNSLFSSEFKIVLYNSIN
jgi:hypothetical protein